MQVGKLNVSVRNSLGKGGSRKLRAQGLVPGVCYGVSKDGPIKPLAITLNVKELRAALDPVRKQNTVIDLTIVDGSTSRQMSALVKDYQWHALRHDITHVDLLAIDPNKEVSADVPLELTGKHKGAINGAQIRVIMRSVTVRAKPADIPVRLTVDVSPLDEGDVLHVGDIQLPAGVSYVTGRDQTIVTCVMPEEDAPAAAATDAAAAAPADAKAAAAPAAAKGAAPAAGAKDAKAAAPAAKAAAAPAAKGAKK